VVKKKAAQCYLRGFELFHLRYREIQNPCLGLNGCTEHSTRAFGKTRCRAVPRPLASRASTFLVRLGFLKSPVTSMMIFVPSPYFMASVGKRIFIDCSPFNPSSSMPSTTLTMLLKIVCSFFSESFGRHQTLITGIIVILSLVELSTYRYDNWNRCVKKYTEYWVDEIDLLVSPPQDDHNCSDTVRERPYPSRTRFLT